MLTFFGSGQNDFKFTDLNEQRKRELKFGSFIGKYQWFGGDKPIQLKETDVAYMDCLIGLVVLHDCRIVIYVETINQRKEFLNKIHPAFVVLTTNN